MLWSLWVKISNVSLSRRLLFEQTNSLYYIQEREKKRERKRVRRTLCSLEGKAATFVWTRSDGRSLWFRAHWCIRRRTCASLLWERTEKKEGENDEIETFLNSSITSDSRNWGLEVRCLHRVCTVDTDRWTHGKRDEVFHGLSTRSIVCRILETTRMKKKNIYEKLPWKMMIEQWISLPRSNAVPCN